MAAARSRKRRSTCAVVVITAAVSLAASLAGCTGHESTPRPLTAGGTPPAQRFQPTSPTTAQPTTTAVGSPRSPELAAGSSLLQALHAVPEAADEVTFTNVAAVKKRLGYDDLASASSVGERFDFWEAARADGSMLTGARLYDDASVMSADYGWTGDDVDWEVDFASTEQGCTRSMLCETARGSILALRHELDWIHVISSLIDNGFTQDQTTPSMWSTTDDKAPFAVIRLLPQLHALATGNPIGIERIDQVVAGAPSIANDVGLLTSRLTHRLGDVESAFFSTGCVTVEQAMGPDVRDNDLSAYFSTNDPSALSSVAHTAVAIVGPDTASIELELTTAVTTDDVALRTNLVDSWRSVQSGLPFSEVAADRAAGSGTVESFDVDVRRMDAFTSMVLTDDTPWALCPATPSG